jgi:hypothetical protein
VAVAVVAQVQWDGRQAADGAVDTVKKAYEYALERVGFDIDAAPLWTDYIDFLKSLPVPAHPHPQKDSERVTMRVSA